MPWHYYKKNDPRGPICASISIIKFTPDWWTSLDVAMQIVD